MLDVAGTFDSTQGIIPYGKSEDEYAKNLEKALGLRAVKNDGAGDCFFLALRQLLVSANILPDPVKQMRQKIVAEMRKNTNPPPYPSQNEKVTFKEYCDNMERPGEYAEQLVILYASHVYNVTIVVFDDDTSQARHQYTPSVSEAEVVLLLKSNIHFEALVSSSLDERVMQAVVAAGECEERYDIWRMRREINDIDYISYPDRGDIYVRGDTYFHNITTETGLQKAPVPSGKGDLFFESLKQVLKSFGHPCASESVDDMRNKVEASMRAQALAATDDSDTRWLVGFDKNFNSFSECRKGLGREDIIKRYCHRLCKESLSTNALVVVYTAFVYELSIAVWYTTQPRMFTFSHPYQTESYTVNLLLTDGLSEFKEGGTKYLALLPSRALLSAENPRTTRLAFGCAVPGRDAVRFLDCAVPARDAAPPVRFLELGCAAPGVSFVD